MAAPLSSPTWAAPPLNLAAAVLPHRAHDPHLHPPARYAHAPRPMDGRARAGLQVDDDTADRDRHDPMGLSLPFTTLSLADDDGDDGDDNNSDQSDAMTDYEPNPRSRSPHAADRSRHLYLGDTAHAVAAAAEPISVSAFSSVDSLAPPTLPPRPADNDGDFDHDAPPSPPSSLRSLATISTSATGMPDMSVAPTPHPRSTVPGVPAFTPPRRASASAASAPTGRTSTGRRLSDWFRSLSSSSSTVSTTSTSSTTQVLCRTRPHTLPPKPKAEDAKHLAEYAKMMKAAQARDAAARAKAAKLRLAREKEAIAALNTWTSQILPNWDKVRYAKKTTDLWFKGVPPRLRGTVWARAVGNPLHVSPDVYELCKRRAADALTSHRMQRAALDAALVEAVAKRTRAPSLSSGESSAATLSGHGETAPPQLPMVFQGRKDTLDLIANDISRTFPALGVFQQPNGPLAEPLASVLEAFAVYRADMGYVQGMSYLAAMLLLNMDDYSAFATLCTMFRHRSGVLPVFYRLDLPLVAKYFSVFSTLLAQVSPGLAAHFDRIGLRPEFFLYEWFLSLFSKPLPLDMAARVWDLYFLDGDAALFRIAVALLRFHERQLVGLAFDECISDVLRLPGRIKPGPAGRVGEVDADVAFWDCVRDSVALDRDAYRALCRGAGLVPPE